MDRRYRVGTGVCLRTTLDFPERAQDILPRICWGVPLRIENDPVLLEAESAELTPRYRTNRSAVDSELSLLTRTDVPTTGIITNPLYREKKPGVGKMA